MGIEVRMPSYRIRAALHDVDGAVYAYCTVPGFKTLVLGLDEQYEVLLEALRHYPRSSEVADRYVRLMMYRYVQHAGDAEAARVEALVDVQRSPMRVPIDVLDPMSRLRAKPIVDIPLPKEGD
jgi:hypothetical protein